jgi:hypothetical protein
MAKKNFNVGLNSVLGLSDEPIAANSKAKTMTISSIKAGLKEGETRATFILNEANVEKIKAIAYWNRRAIKDVFNEALEKFIEKYENANGEIKPAQKK